MSRTSLRILFVWLVKPLRRPAGPTHAGQDLLGLIASAARLARAATDDFAIDDMLSELCHAAATGLQAAGVGVMAVDGTRTRFVQASHPDWVGFETLQQILQAGPCRDAVNSGRAVVADNPDRIAQLWGPQFTKSAAAHDIQAVLALPLLSRGRCWGTLDLYWKQRHAPDDNELGAAQFLADIAVSYLVMAADRDETKSAREQLTHQVLHDQLTTLPNRQLIHELIQHALNNTGRHNTRIGVLFIDIDKFKQVNDRHGHLAGDLVLQEVARRLLQTVRVGDAVGRLSGDEFVVLCEDLPSESDLAVDAIQTLVARLSAAIGEPITVGDQQLRITASIGAASTGGTASPRPQVDDLVHQADLAMYQAKNQHAPHPR